MKIAFFGTPDFALPSLERLLKSQQDKEIEPAKRHKVVCIVCQPDRPSGRDGGTIEFCATKQFGIDNKIPVLQPEKISDEVNLLKKYKPDIIVTCAFGQILKQNVLDYCSHGVINVHASLLPKYRGSSPIQWAIINGEKVTGITIMQTDIGVDTGDIILQMPLEIADTDTAGDVTRLLAELGSIALLKALDQIQDGTAVRTPQSETGIEPTKYPMIDKECAQINWDLPATDINNMVRGFNPWPIAFFNHAAMTIRVHQATPLPNTEDKSAIAGTVYSDNSQIFVACREGILRIDQLQVAGSRVMSAKDFLNGRKL